MKPWAKAAVQGAACGLVFGPVVLIGGRLWWPQIVAAEAQQPAVAEVVRARNFQVVDAAGKVRATLGALPDGRLGLALYDAALRVRASLGMLPDGVPSLNLFGAPGRTRILLSFTAYDSPSLTLWDKAGKLWAAIGAIDLETIKTGFAPGEGGAIGGGVYHVGGGVSQPLLVKKVEPDYPKEALKAKLQGKVVLSIIVDETGMPRNIRVTQPLGLGLDEKAIEAAQKWRFRPAYKDGKPVAVYATVEVNFRLR